MMWSVHVNLWHAAADNLWRHRGRAMASFVPLMVAVSVFAAFCFVRDGMTRDALLSVEAMPDLTVQKMLAGRPDRLSETVGERIARMPNVGHVAPRVWGYVPIRIGGATFTYTMTGIDVRNMPKPDALGLSIERGRFLNAGDTNCAVIGKAVAEALNLDVGSEFALKDELGNAARFRVVGLFTSDVQLYAADLIVVPIKTARTFFGYPAGEATDLCVYLNDPEDAKTVATAILASTQGARILSRDAMREIARQAYGGRAGVFQVLWLILLLTVMLVAWAEASGAKLRTSREIGILKATGWSTANVIEMKVFESAIVAGAATLSGMLAGLAYVLAGAPGIKDYFLGWAVVYPAMELPVYVAGATVGLILAVGVFPHLVATVIPAWASGIVEPDEVIRG